MMKPFNPKPRSCSICSKLYVPRNSMHSVCSPRCAAKKVKQDKADERAKVKTRKEALKPRGQRIRETQAAVNQYVRVRDEGLPCISCGRMHQGQWHAGHYRSTGAASNLRFDLRNIHRQCAPCNTHLSGNLIEYRKGLIERIGLGAVEALEADNTPRHYTNDELDEIKRQAIEMRRAIERSE